MLTLTATPICTLYMALTGVRDISNLNTPPEERLPIVTHVGPYSPKLVRQAILRELERGGQIFFVHNRVNTIDAMKAHLSQLVPEAHVDVGHGQMPEHELADVMHRFNSGDVDILLSTTIVGFGLDIPNANTLIVDRADTFGLAQLYQLRGRVGCGAARAYAYFFRHRKLSPTLEGQQRLEVIAENTSLAWAIRLRCAIWRSVVRATCWALVSTGIFKPWAFIFTRVCWLMLLDEFGLRVATNSNWVIRLRFN